MTAPDNRAPRGPGVTWTAFALGILLALALFAYAVPQDPPPTIAAFAPQPKKVIKVPPPEQTTIGDQSKNNNGRGKGTNGKGPGGPNRVQPPKITKNGKTVPRLRDCVGDLQIPDPQSPPCVPGFLGDNGGATSFGVTRDTIRVAVPNHIDSFVTDQVLQDLFKYFNKHFEFYGRQLVPQFLDDSKDPEGTTTVDQMVADAVTVHDQLKAFIDVGFGTEQQGTTSYFYDKLARLGTLSSQYTVPEPVTLADQARYAANAPYEWNYLQTLDQVHTADADLICSALARRPAKMAGPVLAGKQRKFGMILQYKSNTDPPPLTILRAAVKRCTGNDLDVVSFTDGDVSKFPTMLEKLNSDGVTTVMCMCYWAQLILTGMPTASNQGYYPEWFVDAFGSNDQDYGCHTECPPDQAKAVFGLRASNKALPLGETPYFRAVKDVDPTYQPTGCSGCSANSAPGQVYSHDANGLYETLLQISSGIQAAGPRLTPQTFQDGLFKLNFPNPGCDGPPVYQGCVGFSPANRSMLSSFEIIWYSTATIAVQYGTPGGFCYVDRGRRFRIGHMPTTDAGINAPGAPCR